MSMNVYKEQTEHSGQKEWVKRSRDRNKFGAEQEQEGPHIRSRVNKEKVSYTGKKRPEPVQDL